MSRPIFRKYLQAWQAVIFESLMVSILTLVVALAPQDAAETLKKAFAAPGGYEFKGRTREVDSTQPVIDSGGDVPTEFSGKVAKDGTLAVTASSKTNKAEAFVRAGRQVRRLTWKGEMAIVQMFLDRVTTLCDLARVASIVEKVKDEGLETFEGVACRKFSADLPVEIIGGLGNDMDVRSVKAAYFIAKADERLVGADIVVELGFSGRLLADLAPAPDTFRLREGLLFTVVKPAEPVTVDVPADIEAMLKE